MEVYNTIFYQKKFEKDVNYKDSTPDIYLTKLLNNYFRSLSIIYKYPYKFKWNSIIYDFDFKHELINKTFKLNIHKGMIILDNTLVEIEDQFQLLIDDISVNNYKYCNILVVAEFDFYKYTLNETPPVYKLYLYDSITGELYDPNRTFNISDSIILETYSIRYIRGQFSIIPYNKRLTIDDVYDKLNYIYPNPPPSVIPKPYPSVDNDNPDYTHDHVMIHNHCFSKTHNHNNNIDLIQKYYSENIKIRNNTIPPPLNIKNNILILDDVLLDILGNEYPLTLELFNKCNLELGNINNLSFDFRYVDPYQDALDEYNKNKYNYSKVINYKFIDKSLLLLKLNNRDFYYPIRTENYWLYLLKQYKDFNPIVDLNLNSVKYQYLYEDNIVNYGCFCNS